VASDNKWKIAAFLGIVLIIGTASFMFLPFSSEKENDGPKTPFHGTFQNMRSAEDNMMNFINEEKAQISAQLQQFSFP
jgi:hypothetical protein